MYFLSLLATAPGIPFAQQIIFTMLLNICFSTGIQNAVSSLFSLVWGIKTMSPWAFRKCLGRSLWYLNYLRNVSGCIPEMGTFTKDLQYREMCSMKEAASRGALIFSYYTPICTHLGCLSPSPGIALPAHSGRVGQELTKCPLSCRMSH